MPLVLYLFSKAPKWEAYILEPLEAAKQWMFQLETKNIILFSVVLLLVARWLFKRWLFKMRRRRRRFYYRHIYLKSAAWKRKRRAVLKRDKYKCRYCGKPATQVHHKRYARRIGREPIKWLVAICDWCHKRHH